MKIVPNEYCNECRCNTHFIVTSYDSESIFCEYQCGAKFDLIYDESRIKEVRPMKPIVLRISYYTRKVAEHSKTCSSAKRNQYRSQRLLYYKSIMHGQIKKEGYS